LMKEVLVPARAGLVRAEHYGDGAHDDQKGITK
jgi:hypothetical protein